jgi:hypothetical protein
MLFHAASVGHMKKPFGRHGEGREAIDTVLAIVEDQNRPQLR